MLEAYISGSSSDATNGLLCKTSNFTVSGKALVIACASSPTSLNNYTVTLRIDLLNSSGSVVSQGNTIGDNFTGSRYRSVSRMIVVNAGTYSVGVRFIPQSGATISVPSYCFGRMPVAVIPLE